METVNFRSTSELHRRMEGKTSHRIFILRFNYAKLRQWQRLNWNLIISLMEIKIANKYSFVVADFLCDSNFRDFNSN